MKHLKLFFALFAMLALGVGNAWAQEYALYSGTITEGDYIIVSEGNAMNNTVTSSRLGNTAVTITSDKISNPDAAIIWHIAPSGSYWTIYNAKVNKYAAGTGAKNKAQLLASGTDNKSLWTVTGSSTYEFVNKANEAANVNKNLRRNGTYGFACYATSTGKALSLYKKVEQSGGGETPDPTPVTISLNKTELNLQAGAIETLTATVTGSTESVTWSSSATGVAFVDNTGKVTAVAAGEATITAAIGDVKATCAVKVTAATTPEEPGTGGESGSYTWDLSKKTYTTGTNEVTWTCSIATMHNKGTNATNYLGGDANSRTSSRFYTGNTLTITPAANISISSVEFVATSENYANVLKNSTWTNASASISSSTVTITPSKGASAISATISGTCGFKGVTVYYTQTGGGSGETVVSLIPKNELF